MRYPPLRYYLERVLRNMGGYLAPSSGDEMRQVCSCFHRVAPIFSGRSLLLTVRSFLLTVSLKLTENWLGPLGNFSLTVEIQFGLTCSHASFFPFCPLCWPPLFPPFSGTFSPCSPPRKVLCSVEQGAQHRSWRGAVSGWTSPQNSGRKFLPEICVQEGQHFFCLRWEIGLVFLLTVPPVSLSCLWFPHCQQKMASRK